MDRGTRPKEAAGLGPARRELLFGWPMRWLLILTPGPESGRCGLFFETPGKVAPL